MDSMIFPPTSAGENQMLVEYAPVPEPLLLRNSTEKAQAYIFELVPVNTMHGVVYAKKFVSMCTVNINTLPN